MDNNKTTIGGLPTPVFYPSVSSVSKNVWSVADHIELLVTANFPQFLVSCFDIHKGRNDERIKSALNLANEQSQVILYDSGIYEVVWSRSKRWNRKKYLKTLRDNKVSHAFCLDEYVVSANSPISAEILVDEMIRTSNQLGKEIVSPIIHCKNIDEYVDVCVEISKLINPRLLAIPERELGSGMIEVATNIARIRSALKELDAYQNLHILGTGNPLSMMVYAFMGADSFDGLDWCQTVVDYESATLHHTLHFDLYAYQGRWSNEQDMSFLSKCFLHNLDFYNIWMDNLNHAIEFGQQAKIIEKYIKGPQKDVLLKLIHSEINFEGEKDAAMAN
jgi:queuine/archaeosine tRNA-ribosyltransferase